MASDRRFNKRRRHRKGNATWQPPAKRRNHRRIDHVMAVRHRERQLARIAAQEARVFSY